MSDVSIEEIRAAIRATLAQQDLKLCIENDDAKLEELEDKDLESVVAFLAENVAKRLRGEPISVFG